MYRYDSRSRIFSSGRISDKFSSAFESIKRTVESETEDYILNVNQTEYANHLAEQHSLNVPEINFDDVYADSYERHYVSYKKSKVADRVLELPGI